ncbi:1738_t:CDS:1, partial [Diversispora eburnea]
KRHQWVLGKWWVNGQGQKLYFLTCDHSKPDDTGILLETMSPHNHMETCSCFTLMCNQSPVTPDQSLITSCPS